MIGAIQFMKIGTEITNDPTDTLVFICILCYRAVRGRDHRDRGDQGRTQAGAWGSRYSLRLVKTRRAGYAEGERIAPSGLKSIRRNIMHPELGRDVGYRVG